VWERRYVDSPTAPVSEVAGELAAALSHWTGTVTSFLEEVSGEPVDADVLCHRRASATDVLGSDLMLTGELFLRSALLTGRRSWRQFVYAETALAADVLPDQVLRKLELTADPIGRVLDEAAVRTTRQQIDGPPTPGLAGSEVPAVVRLALSSRRYLISVDGRSMMIIGEWFLPSLGEVLISQRMLQRRTGVGHGGEQPAQPT
jgi:chorismate-pyruvate lyase